MAGTGRKIKESMLKKPKHGIMYNCGCTADGDNIANYCPIHGDAIMDFKKALKKPKKKTKSKSDLQKKADGLYQKLGKLEFKECFFAGPECNGDVVMHHFIKKGSSANLRYDPQNRIPLCYLKHHCLIHKQPELLNSKIALRKGQAWIDYIEQNKYNPNLKTNKTYYQSIIAELEESIRNLK